MESPLLSSASPVILRRLIDFDTSLSLRIHTSCRSVPRLVLEALEISGDGRYWFPIPIALLVLSWARPFALGLLIGSVLDLLTIIIVKLLIRRPRPTYNKAGMTVVFADDHWSFPSGHASRVFFIAAYLQLSAASLRLDRRWPSDLFPMVVIIWAAATAASRVLLGRHFVFDVVAGAVLGVFEALLIFYFLHI